MAIFIVSLILGLLILSLYFKHELKTDNFIREDSLKVVHVKHSLHEMKERNCILPKLDIWNLFIGSFIKKNNKIYCTIEKIDDWLFFDSKEQQLKISDDMKKYENNLKCTIKYINSLNNTHSNITYNKFPIKDLKSDFFDVKCNINGTDNEWSKYFMRAILNSEKVEKLRKLKKPDNWTGWNVHIISYGSLSQMSYKRFLSKSLKFFEKNLEGFIMEGYNTLGNQTLQSFIPYFTGKSELELLKIKNLYNENLTVNDVYSFVWSNFSDIGYVTLFGEDKFKNSTFYDYFKNQPTDHILGTSFKYTENVFGDYCFRDTMQHKEWLDYSTSFIEAYNHFNIPRFSFLHHSSLTKNYLKNVENIDDDLYEYLKYNYNNGNFKNDFIILISDNGFISNEFRNTQQGRLEERLPFLGIRLPKNINNKEYKKKLLRNLNFNRNTLTTPFDIYTTLLDILSLPNDYKLDIEQKMDKRGLSIIKPIHKNRNCLNADIELHWCTCMEWKNIPNNTKYTDAIIVLVKKYITEINKLLLTESKYCSQLKLDKIVSAKWLVPNKEILSNNNLLNKNDFKSNDNDLIEISESTYKIKFITQPGGTNYEITTHLNFLDTKMYVNMWNLTSLNSQYDFSHCMRDKVDKLLNYCVCYDKHNDKN
ncbi:Protein of unknown function DUF229 family and Alkaline phosphatase-like, alpha/beta/alpha domain and Alkaline-phosphatase-like, core domain-containing protein [Strongyloides ratti]|uniref:Sulfatase N-terminal domain-containing protein n=1 Tax=Strongyloides ratti TaxID=34506 RepID=A0A090KW26_STRRB|nr:Protein of unknown function DUF229 family and Alkaline phosphatase-like, alpha/beta/alpha domain and Alkaline-phosphatase-like, core domain-containing protein [Strongyloides ratti]CEF59477.1 Protein of unknown function DUF229 family and Alkaline phosphatase-like, alpha/beta/alpha domain and Alkaline-phosphatase-like, core domain-containing protein [Strongyloides ratti]